MLHKMSSCFHTIKQKNRPVVSINMKIVSCLLLCLALIVPSYAFSCKTEPERCGKGECCVEYGFFGRCRPLLKEGEKCELKPLKSQFDKHLYLNVCPCAKGLTCEEDDNGYGITGQCVAK